MDRRSIVLLGVLGILVVISIVVWKNSSGEESAEVFNTAMAEYTCPSCNQAFSMTGAESVEALRSDEGIICPHCGKPLDRKSVLGARELGGAETADAAAEEPEEYDEPVKAETGTMRKPG